MAANMNIKKQVQAIQKQQKKLAEMADALKSKCTHTVRGDLDIVPDKSYKQGSLHFICRQCQKKLDLSRIQDDKLQEACDIIDRAIDTIKITIDPNREDDYKILKRMARTQHRVRTTVIPYYNAALKKNSSAGRRGNGRGGRRGNGNSGIWDSPGTLR